MYNELSTFVCKKNKNTDREIRLFTSVVHNIVYRIIILLNLNIIVFFSHIIICSTRKRPIIHTECTHVIG